MLLLALGGSTNKLVNRVCINMQYSNFYKVEHDNHATKLINLITHENINLFFPAFYLLGFTYQASSRFK